MIKVNSREREIVKYKKERILFTFSLFPLAAALLALLLGSTIGVLGIYAFGAFIFTTIMLLALILRQDEFAAIVVIAASLYIDWYLGEHFISLVVTLGLLCIFLLDRSSQHVRVELRALWLWALLLVLAIPPAIQGALTSRDILIYYPGIIFGAFLMYLLGKVIVRNTANVRTFMKLLAAFATLIALHTIIKKATGIFLLSSSRVDNYILSNPDYQLNIIGTNIERLGSFFIQPDFLGIFLSTMVFIPVGLFLESTSFMGKFFYLAEIILMMPALLFTYSASGWVAIAIGIIPLVIFAANMRYRIQIGLFMVIAVIVLLLGFSSQVGLLLQHAFDPKELLLRNGLWLTALRVIQAFPLTGIGLGHYAYITRAEPYRSPQVAIPIDHPHNSYLELGAMAGLPVLFVFLSLIFFTLWQTLRNWIKLDAQSRTLLSAGIAAVIALSVNSWTNEGWTLPPLAALGWLILGVISSPLLREKPNSEMVQR
jgi:O-antigen ligase